MEATNSKPRFKIVLPNNGVLSKNLQVVQQPLLVRAPLKNISNIQPQFFKPLPTTVRPISVSSVSSKVLSSENVRPAATQPIVLNPPVIQRVNSQPKIISKPNVPATQPATLQVQPKILPKTFPVLEQVISDSDVPPPVPTAPITNNDVNPEPEQATSSTAPSRPQPENGTNGKSKGKGKGRKSDGENGGVGTWTHEETFELIMQYEANRCLYDLEHPQYKDRVAKMRAYQKILQVLTIYRPSRTEAEVKAKINSLRTQYLREANREISERTSGTSPDYVFESTMMFYEDLNFLQKSICNKKGSTNLMYKDANDKAQDNDGDAIDNLIAEEEELDQDHLPKKRKKEQPKKATIEDQMVNIMDKCSASLEVISQRKKETQTSDSSTQNGKMYEGFCLMVGERMRAMPTPKALQLQDKIMQVIANFSAE